ncbi:MAG: NAD-dependent deacylase [Cyclobacteriaceae bacterium]
MGSKKIVVLTGAGISAESGLRTFRDAGGLWEGYDVMEVASIDGWRRNPALVLDFYNQRRKQARSAKPNAGHMALAQLEAEFDVTIVTQNVDTLHEQAGSTDVIHLHGNLFQSKSSVDDSLIYDIGEQEINLGDKCEKGSQLRPNIVWFGEMVPMMEVAARIASGSDIFMVVGTSLAVYPAASLIDFVNPEAPKYIIDPKIPDLYGTNYHSFEEVASSGIVKAIQHLKDNMA